MPIYVDQEKDGTNPSHQRRGSRGRQEGSPLPCGVIATVAAAGPDIRHVVYPGDSIVT